MTSPDVDGITWRKSSFSGTSGDCVEVGWPDPSTSVAVRDSKQGSGPPLGFPVPDWRAFLASLPR